MLVDDHRIVREGVRALLEVELDLVVVGEAEDGEEAVRVALERRPDVVLMDINMPVANGLEATRRIVAVAPEIRIIGFSMYDDSDMAEAMLRAGAVGFLNKGRPSVEIVTAIRGQAAASIP